MHFPLTLPYLSSGRLPALAGSSCGRPVEGSEAVGLLEECDPYWNRCDGRLASLGGSEGHRAGKCGSALPGTCCQLRCFHTPESLNACMGHACPWSFLACKMGFLIVPGLNLNHTGLCCSQSYEVSLPVFKK